MAINRLQDDLLLEFREEKKMILNQLELIDPLSVSLRKPAARRLASKGLLVFGEVLCWLMVLVTVGFGVFLRQLYPYYYLFQLQREEFTRTFGTVNIQRLHWGIYILIGIIALLFFLLARSLRRIRLKNDILHMAGRHMKTLVGQHLHRKAALDAIEQRHFLQLPPETPRAADDVNDVANPGYEPA